MYTRRGENAEKGNDTGGLGFQMNTSGFLYFRPSSNKVHRARSVVIELLTSIVYEWTRDLWKVSGRHIPLEERIQQQMDHMQTYISRDLFLFFLWLRVIGVGRVVDQAHTASSVSTQPSQAMEAPEWFCTLVENGIEDEAVLSYLALRYRTHEIDPSLEGTPTPSSGRTIQWSIDVHEPSPGAPLSRRMFAAWLWSVQPEFPSTITGALTSVNGHLVFREWWSELVEHALVDVWNTRTLPPPPRTQEFSLWDSTWMEDGALPAASALDATPPLFSLALTSLHALGSDA